MSQSSRYNYHYRDDDLIEYSMDEMIERYRKGQHLTWRQRQDVERALAARSAAASQAAE